MFDPANKEWPHERFTLGNGITLKREHPPRKLGGCLAINMNYKHAYHAGNHTEVFKHTVLSLLILELRKKPTPFGVLDTHAGAGTYDLLSPEALRTGEAQRGIGRIMGKAIPMASNYLAIVRTLNPNGLRYYPGSPAIVRSLLRDNDRLIACEIRPDDAALLRATFRGDRRVAVHRRDGYEAITAFVPLSPKRGLVFIDPPFENDDECLLFTDAVNSGLEKWPTGIYVAWYPIKTGTERRDLRRQYRLSHAQTLCCEFLVQPTDGETLAGGGLLISNPPWQFEEKLRVLCQELAHAFDSDRGWHLEWWRRE
jgi:23S rRNA (adenine2030-N6)-methyltransferase